MADKRATLDKQIRQFKRQVRKHVQCTLEEESAILFTPGKTTCDCLKGIGIVGKHGGPRFNVYTDSDTQDALAVKLVLLGHSIGQ